VQTDLEHVEKPALYNEREFLDVRCIHQGAPDKGEHGGTNLSAFLPETIADVPSAREKRFPTHLSAWKTDERYPQFRFYHSFRMHPPNLPFGFSFRHDSSSLLEKGRAPAERKR
jgi:hypothetical protein